MDNIEEYVLRSGACFQTSLERTGAQFFDGEMAQTAKNTALRHSTFTICRSFQTSGLEMIGVCEIQQKTR